MSAQLRTRREAREHRTATRLRSLLTAAVATTLAVAPWSERAVAPLMALVCVFAGVVVLFERHVHVPMTLRACALVPIGQTLTLPFAPDLPWSWRLVAMSWMGWICALGVAQLDARRRAWILVAVSASAAVVALGSLADLGALSSHEGGGVINGRLQGPLAQPNELGSLMQMALPFVLLTTFAAWAPRDGRIRARTWRVMSVVGLAGVVAALVFSLSRGAWIGTLVTLTLVALVRPAARRGLLTFGLALVLGGALAAAAGGSFVSAVSARFDSLTSPTRSASDERPAIWAYASELVDGRPFTGVGVGGLPETAGDATFGMTNVAPLHAHSIVLTALAEGGLLALATLSVLLVVGVRVLARMNARGAPVVEVAAAAALAGAFVHGVIDFPWRAPALTATTWLLVGLLPVGVTRSRRSSTKGNP